MLIIWRIQKEMNQLLVVVENARLQKYFAEWTKPKKLFRFVILWLLYPLMVALVISNQKVAFWSFYMSIEKAFPFKMHIGTAFSI